MTVLIAGGILAGVAAMIVRMHLVRIRRKRHARLVDTLERSAKRIEADRARMIVMQEGKS